MKIFINYGVPVCLIIVYNVLLNLLLDKLEFGLAVTCVFNFAFGLITGYLWSRWFGIEYDGYFDEE